MVTTVRVALVIGVSLLVGSISNIVSVKLEEIEMRSGLQISSATYEPPDRGQPKRTRGGIRYQVEQNHWDTERQGESTHGTHSAV